MAEFTAGRVEVSRSRIQDCLGSIATCVHHVGDTGDRFRLPIVGGIPGYP
ncbi:MAG TPA: hypothetical protein PLU40_04945 [Methanoculleus sp.]|nr:hypothetical protein [Methanoculleus sp.]HQD24355.1 hypothetical protein [Methanoculleus sp.]